MAYEKIGFKSGDTLKAIQMNHIEEGIAALDSAIENIGGPLTITETTMSSEDGGNNIIVFSDGSTITIKNGSKGSPGTKGNTGSTGPAGPAGYTPVKGVDFWTLAEQESIVQDVIAALGTPVFGQVDADNNIILTGALTDGVYTLKYEGANGMQSVIGSLTVGSGEPEQTYTNLFDPAAATLNTRMSGNDQTAKAQDGYVMTKKIAIPSTHVIHGSNESGSFVVVPAAYWNNSANVFFYDVDNPIAYLNAGVTAGTVVGDWVKLPMQNQWEYSATANGMVVSLHVKDSAITANDIQNIKIYFDEIPE